MLVLEYPCIFPYIPIYPLCVIYTSASASLSLFSPLPLPLHLPLPLPLPLSLSLSLSVSLSLSLSRFSHPFIYIAHAPLHRPLYPYTWGLSNIPSSRIGGLRRACAQLARACARAVWLTMVFAKAHHIKTKMSRACSNPCANLAPCLRGACARRVFDKLCYTWFSLI